MLGHDKVPKIVFKGVLKKQKRKMDFVSTLYPMHLGWHATMSLESYVCLCAPRVLLKC